MRGRVSRYLRFQVAMCRKRTYLVIDSWKHRIQLTWRFLCWKFYSNIAMSPGFKCRRWSGRNAVPSKTLMSFVWYWSSLTSVSSNPQRIGTHLLIPEWSLQSNCLATIVPCFEQSRLLVELFMSQWENFLKGCERLTQWGPTMIYCKHPMRLAI